MQTSKAIQDCIKIEMMNNKINITEFSVLEVLYFKGKQTIQQIGKSILISSGSMTYVIDKLEQKGLLNRIDCPNDRRVIHVVLTEDGMNFMEKVMPNHRALIDNMFGDLTDQESETMVKLLKKVSKRVEA
jgi:MarR family 2-MHQ and catechol resistance regulon transcriptional repressor